MQGLTENETKGILTKILELESLCNFLGFILSATESKLDDKDFSEIEIAFHGIYMNFKILSVNLMQIKEMIDK